MGRGFNEGDQDGWVPCGDDVDTGCSEDGCDSLAASEVGSEEAGRKEVTLLFSSDAEWGSMFFDSFAEIARSLKVIAYELQELRALRALRLLAREIGEIEEDLDPKLSHGQVILKMKTIQVGGTSLATLALLDQQGAPFTIDSTYTVAYTASNPTTVSVGASNADGSATITGLAADPGNQIGATVTRPDGVLVTLTPDTLVITEVTPVPVLTSGSVVLT